MKIKIELDIDDEKELSLLMLRARNLAVLQARDGESREDPIIRNGTRVGTVTVLPDE